MKNFLKHAGRILLSSIVMFVLWIVCLSIGNMIFPAEVKPSTSSPEFSLLMILAVSFINTAVLYLWVQKTNGGFMKIALMVFTVMFGVQYFLSMIEAYYFNNALKMPENLMFGLSTGGLILSILYAPFITWIGRNPTSAIPENKVLIETEHTPVISMIKILVLGLIIYPAIYFLAGYYIAWQFEAVRVFYTGSATIQPFLSMMQGNFKSTLPYLCMFRGLIWIMLGLLIYNSTKMKPVNKGLLIGMIFALLMNSQHLIPNPYFPYAVTSAHFIETASSNFVWGFLLAIIWAMPGHFPKPGYFPKVEHLES
jgi:hypothetical protein